MKRQSELEASNPNKKHCNYSSNEFFQQGCELYKSSIQSQKLLGIKLIKKSVEMGNSYACAALGQIYIELQALDKVIKYYTRGAELNDPVCLFNLGLIFHNELYGMKKDYEKIVDYWTRAAAQGHLKARFNYAQLIYTEEIECDKNIALEIFQDSARLGITEAYYRLGTIYTDGKLVEKNLDLAREYYEKGTEKCHIASASKLAMMYFDGNGVEIDKEKAALIFKDVADRTRNIQASYNYATLVFTENELKEHSQNGIKYLIFAAESGHPSAAHTMGLFLSKGHYLEQDKEKAIYYYKKGAEKGHAKCLFQLAKIYEEGICVEKNMATALRYYKLAVEKGAPKECLENVLKLNVERGEYAS